MDSNPSLWSPAEVSAIETALSTDRFARYLDAASGESQALEYYAWNTALAAAFYGPLQCLEIALRNSVHERLAVGFGASWYRSDAVLTGRDLAVAREAIERVERTNGAATPGRVVAELSLGFWVGLFANVYDQTLWRTDLYRLFKPRPGRSELHDKLDRIRTLRNRIAHHEPIFQRNLLEDYNRTRDVLQSISPELCGWMEHHNRVLDVIAAGPESHARF